MTLDTPSECPFYLISRVTLQVTSALKKGLTEVGLDHVKPAYLGVLLCLWQQDNRIVIDLARCARLEPSTMTGLLDRMEQDGLVARSPDPDDRRAQRILLTPEGRRAKQPVLALVTGAIERMLGGVRERDLDALRGALRRVLANADKGGTP